MWDVGRENVGDVGCGMWDMQFSPVFGLFPLWCVGFSCFVFVFFGLLMVEFGRTKEASFFLSFLAPLVSPRWQSVFCFSLFSPVLAPFILVTCFFSKHSTLYPLSPSLGKSKANMHTHGAKHICYQLKYT